MKLERSVVVGGSGSCLFDFISVYRVALYVLRSSKAVLMIRILTNYNASFVIDLASKSISFNLSYIPTSW